MSTSSVVINPIVPGSAEWDRRKKVAKRCRDQVKVYKRRAGKKQFDIDEDVIKELFRLPCYYCGGATRYENGEPVCGVDRVNNRLGYVKSNIVPCCFTCNFMKGTFNITEFVEQCVKVAERHKTVNLLESCFIEQRDK